MNRRVVVIGGGLAGMQAALRCADGGAGVTLIEARRRLGGATFSFRRNGYRLDNGQHVFLRCCSAYRDFLRRIGVEDRVTLQPRLRIPVVGADGKTRWLRRGRLPAPLHLSSSVAAFSYLSPRDRIAFARAALQLRKLRRTPELDHVTFGSWLRDHGQSPEAISALWDLIVLPTLNLRSDEASLDLAAMVFQTGLLTDAPAADIGYARVPLDDIHAGPGRAALEAAGVRIVTGASVQRLEGGTPWFVVGRDLNEAAHAVIVAVPPAAAGELLPELEGACRALGSSPVVNVHLLFDRRVMPFEFAAGIGSPVQWVFDRTAAAGIDEGQLLSVSLSAADGYLDQPAAVLRDTFVDAVGAMFPAAGQAQLLDAAVTREKDATFRQAAGAGACRPAARTARSGVYVAGAWTDTGWPATMEGAVRSGAAAADAALADFAERPLLEEVGA